MVKVTRILVTLAVAVGLMLSNTSSIFAAKPSLVSRLNISGTVVEKGEISNDEGFIDLKAGGGLVKVLVTAETKYNVPGKEKATFADIKVADRIKVVATGVNTSGGIIASDVTALPQFVYRPYLLRKVLMHLPPQLIKITLFNMPPQIVKTWINLPPPAD